MGGERPELLTVSPWLLLSQAGSPGSLHPIPLSLVTCWELGAAPAPSEPQLPSSSPRSSFFQKDGEIQGCRATGPCSGGSSLELSLLLPSPSVLGLCSPKPAWSLVGPPAALHAACGEGWCSARCLVRGAGSHSRDLSFPASTSVAVHQVTVSSRPLPLVSGAGAPEAARPVGVALCQPPS